MDHDYSAIDHLTAGDERMSQHVRANIAVLARRTDDPELRQLCLDVLGGRTSVRRVYEHPSFRSRLRTSLANLRAGLDRLPEQQRRSLLDQVGTRHTPDELIERLNQG